MVSWLRFRRLRLSRSKARVGGESTKLQGCLIWDVPGGGIRGVARGVFTHQIFRGYQRGYFPIPPLGNPDEVIYSSLSGKKFSKPSPRTKPRS